MISNHGTAICLTKGSASIIFDRVIQTLSGSISGIEMVCFVRSLLLPILLKARQNRLTPFFQQV
jgi:hypothetical protein